MEALSIMARPDRRRNKRTSSDRRGQGGQAQHLDPSPPPSRDGKDMFRAIKSARVRNRVRTAMFNTQGVPTNHLEVRAI